MIRSTHNLLRRTLVVLGAFAGFAGATGVLAQGTVTLSSGGSCTYSAMTIQPNGNVSVSCTSGGTPQTPGKAVFTISGPTSVQPSTPYTAGQFKVSRTDTNGPSGLVAFGYTVTGTGCQYHSAGPFWLSASGAGTSSQDLSVTTTASGSCTITVTAQEGHTAGTPLTLTIAGGTTPPPEGCPQPAGGSLNRSNNIGLLYRDGGGSSVDQLRMDSGTIAYYKVVASPKPEQSVVVMFTQGQQPNTPPGIITEFSVSRCPGVIDTTVPQCYYRSSQINANAINIYTAAVSGSGFLWNSQQSLGDRGCYAPIADRDYYVNVRWTYGSCPWGAGNCGTSMQWAPTGSNF